MKEFCGYKDKEGYIFEDELECKISDLKIDINDKHRELGNISGLIYNNLSKRAKKALLPISFEVHELCSVFTKVVLSDPDYFILKLKEKEALIKDIEKLNGLIDEYNKMKNFKIHKPWYLKIKWW